MTRTAQLRVYVPESDLPPVEPIVDMGMVMSMVEPWGLVDSGEPPVRTLEWEGARFSCPRNLEFRVLEAVVGLSAVFDRSALIPAEVTEWARGVLTGALRTDRTVRSHVLTSPWHIPLRWFVAFSPDEKVIDHSSGDVAVVYRTSLASAKTRIEQATEILKRTMNPSPVADDVAGLGAWLDSFESAEAVLELDYSSVGGLFGEADLVLDDSVE
ncbi:MAG: hypothetical protein GEU79_02650, partial [Acidimicrobiia bacterium]|nr:hypothetical protein [Acidimicrobiia bacterium]